MWDVLSTFLHARGTGAPVSHERARELPPQERVCFCALEGSAVYQQGMVNDKHPFITLYQMLLRLASTALWALLGWMYLDEVLPLEARCWKKL